MRSSAINALGIACLVVWSANGQAASAKIYNGITKQEFLAFAKRQGWETRKMRAPREIRLAIAGQSFSLYLGDCDASGRCKSGRLRKSWFSPLKSRRFVGTWNRLNFGATAFNQPFLSLQRNLHLVGVSDQYLKDVIGEIWPRVVRKFWADAKKQAQKERKSAK